MILLKLEINILWWSLWWDFTVCRIFNGQFVYVLNIIEISNNN